MPTSVTTTPELLLLERDAIRVEIALRPFSFTVRRSGRRLLRNAGVWVADGVVHDTFVQFTEGVIAAVGGRPSVSSTESLHQRHPGSCGRGRSRRSAGSCA